MSFPLAGFRTPSGIVKASQKVSQFKTDFSLLCNYAEWCLQPIGVLSSSNIGQPRAVTLTCVVLGASGNSAANILSMLFISSFESHCGFKHSIEKIEKERKESTRKHYYHPFYYLEFICSIFIEIQN